MPKVPSVRHVWSGRSIASAAKWWIAAMTWACVSSSRIRPAIDLYQPHDIHLEFIKRFKEHWDRVRVQDFA